MERGGFLDDGAFLFLIEKKISREGVWGFFYKLGKSRQRTERLTIAHTRKDSEFRECNFCGKRVGKGVKWAWGDIEGYL